LTRARAGRTVPAVPRIVRLIALLAGCGDENVVQVTVTVRTGTTTAVTPTAPVTTVTTTAPVTTAPAADLADLRLRLPAQDSIPSLNSGSVEQKPTAQSMVDALYSVGDPNISAAVSRLTAGGYEGGVLRDQRGANPARGLTLMRIYIFRMRDRAAAQAEVDAAAAELKATTSAPIRDLQVPSVPTAKAMRISPTVGGQRAEVLYVSFAAGRDLYGIQVFSRADAKLYQPEVLELAESLHRAWNTTG